MLGRGNESPQAAEAFGFEVLEDLMISHLGLSGVGAGRASFRYRPGVRLPSPLVH